MFAIIAIISFILTIVFFFVVWKISHVTWRECFADTRYIVADNSLNISSENKNIMQVSNAAYTKIIDSIKTNNVIDKNILGVDGSKIILYTDPYIDYYVFNNVKNTSEYKDGIFICLSYTKLMADDCIWNLEGKTVAYLYLSDYLFIQALAKGYRLDVDKIAIKKITLDDLNSTNKTFDYCMTYAVVGSDYMAVIDNCLYFKNGFKDVSFDRMKPYNPFLKENYQSMRYYFNDELRRTYVNDANNVLIPMMNYKIIEDTKTIERFVTRLNLPEDYVSKEAGTGYSCYGNINISHNKYECNSYYNADGTPKTYYSLWDKQCKVNTDCPYYQANTNYPNERGGCNKGFCEFPVGVKRLGYIKYDDNGLNKPMCYGCDDVKDLDCCSKNDNPDYVFSNDFEDRKRSDLDTIISLLDYRIE
jgi:hypothetical protein